MRFLMAAISIIAVFATPAWAIDGEVLITQEKAIQGGITPRDKPGFPIEINTPGKYKLASDLTVMGSMLRGINVNNDNVHIDFNGFTMRPHYQARVSQGIVGLYGLVVKNARIMQFDNIGVQALSVTIANSEVSLIGAVAIKVIEQGYITDNVITDSARIGVECLGTCVVSGNLIARNSIGVKMQTGLVSDNSITSNRSLAIKGSPQVGYGGNSLIMNGRDGVQVTGSPIPVQPNACVPACE